MPIQQSAITLCTCTNNECIDTRGVYALAVYDSDSILLENVSYKWNMAVNCYCH